LPWGQLGIDVVVGPPVFLPAYDKARAHLLLAPSGSCCHCSVKDDPPADIKGADRSSLVSKKKNSKMAVISSNASLHDKCWSPVIGDSYETVGN